MEAQKMNEKIQADQYMDDKDLLSESLQQIGSFILAGLVYKYGITTDLTTITNAHGKSVKDNLVTLDIPAWGKEILFQEALDNLSELAEIARIQNQEYRDRLGDVEK